MANEMARPLRADAHIDIPWQLTKQGYLDLSTDLTGKTKVDVSRAKKGGLDVAFFALYLSDSMQDDLGPQRSKIAIDYQFDLLRAQHRVGIVRTVGDVRATANLGLLPVFLGLEGGRLLDNGRYLELFKQAGVKYLTVTHNKSTEWADSATDLVRHGGLTKFGRSLVRTATDLGVFMDVSHAHYLTINHVLEESCLPVVATHSGCRALLDHPRNLTDYQIRQLALVCIPFVRNFVGPHREDVLNHIDHAVQLVGPTHVGIGSDLDGARLCDDIRDVSEWSDVVIEGLLKRGYSTEDVDNIAGMNLLRVLG